MEKNNNKPKLRFPEFTDPWEQRELGECFTERQERSSSGELISVTINYGIMRASDLGKIDNSSNDKSKYKKVEIGDIAYNSMRMWQGASGYSAYSGIVSPAYTVIIPRKDVDALFFSFMFKKSEMIQTFQNRSQGMTSDTWNLKFPAFSKIKINIPEKQEQEKVGTFLQELDNLITLHQRKLNHLQDKKKGLLQKMFPKKGKDLPELRFPGFTDPWEQCKLGEIGTVQTCKRIFKEQTSEIGDIPFYKNGTLGLKADAYISREVFEEYKELYPYPRVGDVLISVVGSIGRTAEYKGNAEYFQDSNIVWLKTDNNIIDKKFLKISYQITDWLIEGSTIKHLYNDNILASKIWIPSSIDEQKAIGVFLDFLDKLITLHQRKLNHLQEQKKALLQQMFV